MAFLLKYSKQLAADKASEKDINSIDAAMTAVSLWRTAAIVKGLPSVDALAFNMTVPAEADDDADVDDDDDHLDDLDGTEQSVDHDGQNGDNNTTAKSKKATKDVVIPTDLPAFVRKEWRAVQLPLKQLRNARYSVAAKFLPAPSFWTEWVNDEKALLLLLSELRTAFDEKASAASRDLDESSNNTQKQNQQQEEFPLEAALVEQHKRLLEVTLRAADATAGARDSIDFAFALTGLQTGTLAATSTCLNPTSSSNSAGIDDHQRQWTPLSLAAKVLSVAGPWPQYRHLAHLHIADLLSEEADRVGAGGDIVTDPIDAVADGQNENDTNEGGADGDQNDDDEKNQKMAERTAQKLEQRLRRHYARFFATSTSALPSASHVTLRALSAAITGTTHQQQDAHDYTHTDPTTSTTTTMTSTPVVTNATIAAAAKKIAQHQSSGAQNLLGFTPAGLDAVQLVNDHFEQWEVDVGSKGAKSVTSAFESATKKLAAVQEASQALLRDLRSSVTLAPTASAGTPSASGSGVPANSDTAASPRSLPDVISADPFDLSNRRWTALTAAKSQSAGGKKIGVDVKAAVIEELLVEDPQNVSLWSALIDADAAACPRRTVAVALRALHSVCPLDLLSSSVPFASASTAGGSLQDQAGAISTVCDGDGDGESSETSKEADAQRRFNSAVSAVAAAAKFWHRIVAVARTYARDAEIRASSKSNNAAAMSLALLSAVEESAAMVPPTATSAKPTKCQSIGTTGANSTETEEQPSKNDETLSVNDLREKFSAALHDRFDEEVASVALTHPPAQLLTMALRWCVTVASMLRSLAAKTTATTQESVATSDEKTQRTQSSSCGIESPLLIGDAMSSSSSLSSEEINAAMSAVAGVATEALWAMAVRCKPSLSRGAGVSGGAIGSGAANNSNTISGAKTGATSAAPVSAPTAFSVADEDLTSLNLSEWGFEVNAASVVAWATRLFPPVADDVPSLEHVGEIDLDLDLDDEDQGAKKETVNEEQTNGGEQSSSSPTAASPSKHAVMAAPPLWFAKAALDAARVVSSLRSALDAPPSVMSSSGHVHDGSQRKRAVDHDGKNTTTTTPSSTTTTEEGYWMERQSMIAKSMLSFIAITEHSGRFGLPHAVVAADAIAMRVALDGRAALPGARRAWRNLIRIAQSFQTLSSSFDPKRTQQDHSHIAGDVFSCESSLQRQLLQSNDAIARIGAVWQATEAFAMSPPSAIVEARSAVYKATAAHNSNHVRSAHEDIVAPGKRPRE